MRHGLLIIIFLFVCSISLPAQFSASGGIGQPYEEKSVAAIEAAYLFNTLPGATLTYQSSNSSITFVKYDINGTQTSIPASDISYSGASYEIRNLQDGFGYFASEENKAVWVIDYSQHTVTINSVTVPQSENEGEGCGTVAISVDKTDTPLQYISPYGASAGTLERKFNIEWQTLEWDSNSEQFSEETGEKLNTAINNTINVSAPLKDTHFTVSGDQYATHFGMTKSATSDEYRATAIEVYITYNDIKNGIESDTIDSEGSAPITRHFYGHANEPTAYHFDWYIYKNGDKTNYLARFQNETDITYTFTEAGKYEVELIVASENNICSATAGVDEFEISESSLEIPNFFSPGTSPGYNDEFKVKYKSLVKFKASIFNRWGNKLYEWTDPEQGWDGKYKGKYVSPGVYFYVIDATGSEGKRYKKGGDINIVRGK